MALFQRNKKSDEKTQVIEAPKASSITQDTIARRSDVLRNPRITEKATDHQTRGVYAFDVAENATKRSVASAISTLYKVTPKMIRIVPVPAKIKRSVRTGARGVTRRGKKAYVYLRKGDTITIS